MKELKRSPIAMALLLCGSAFAGDPDPKVVNTTGGTMKNATLVVDFSVGEIAISTLSGTNGKTTQGFLQPTSNLTTAVENQVIENAVLIYPNPVPDKLFFSTKNETVSRATVYAMDGRKIATFDYPETSISLENLSSGVYQVEFLGSQNQVVFNSKIVKQ